MVIIIDNYDSFTYNLYQYVGVHSSNVKVFKNDSISIQSLDKMTPDKIIISPGPGHPKDSKVSLDCIRYFTGKIPILGVCLGHQAIGMIYGAEIENSNIVCHGKTSMISHDGNEIFEGLSNPFEATRYHSLIIKKDTIPDDFNIIATYDNMVMGIKHKSHLLYGVQFHPESIKTDNGLKIIKNFLDL